MSNDKITSDDLFSNGFDKEIIAALEKITDALKKQEQQQIKNIRAYGDIANSVGKINNVDSIDKINKAYADQKKAVEDLDKTRKAIIQSEKETQKARLEEIKLMRAREKAFDDYEKKLQKGLKIESDEKNAFIQKSKALEELRRKYLAVAAAKGIDAKESKELLAKLQPLDKEIKEISASAGKFHLNVGNYASAVNNILNAAGVTIGTAGVIGLGKAVIETRAEFQKFEAVLTNTLGSHSEAQKSLTEIKDFAAKTPFGVKELTEDFVKLANTGFKPTIEELRQLGDLASSQGKSFDQLTEAIIDAQTGEFERLKEFGIRASKEGDKVSFTFKGVKTQVDFTDESIRKYILSLGDAKGVSGSMAAISETLEGKISNLKDSYDDFLNTVGEKTAPAIGIAIESLNTLLEGIKGFISETSDFLSGNLVSSENIKDLQRVDGITQTIAKQIEAAGFRIGNVYDAADQKSAKALASIVNGTDLYVEAVKNAKNNQEEYTKATIGTNQQLADLTRRYDDGKITVYEYSAGVKLYKERLIQLNQTIQDINKKGVVPKTLTKEQLAEIERLNKQIADDNARLLKQIEDQKVQAILSDQQSEEAAAKLDYERRKKDIETSKADEKIKNDALIQLDLEYYNKRADIENKYNDIKENDEKQRIDAANSLLVQQNEANIKTQQEFDKYELEALQSKYGEAEKIIAKQEIATKIALGTATPEEVQAYNDLIKRENAEKLKEASDLAAKTLSIVEKQLQREQQLKDQALQDEIDRKQKAVDDQRERANNGLENDLAYEEKALAEAQRAKDNQAKKEQSQLKRIAFFKLLAANIDIDPRNAIVKTIDETLFAAAIAGQFYVGTEKVADSLKGNKVHSGRDGYVIAVDGEERIVPGQENKMIGDLTNKELAQLAFDYNHGKLLPDIAISRDLPNKSFAENAFGSMHLHQLAALHKEMEQTRKAIEEKPVSSFEINGFDLIERTIKKNVKTVVTHKNKFRF